ncbi:ethanolamine utilization protein [Azoarcus sp. L1K30]|uniref:3'-5' exonuclease family protein n=1 Tax=Azoarcus sp. L1K30 TaxID=2820277 RepID=UPI001B829E39|nr:3'-5' exonuclease family protein [Azoarcus sp. L1K30]MBR0567221.1 ethanolamine utilization protein [Azoarcus sp. L1K30]
MALPERLAFVDLETTGANLLRDGITEIAIIRVERGSVVERWEQLLNPGRSIPAKIQDFIGITDAMVADAPVFADVADTVHALLEDCVFVAHNARFDYGFLKSAFAGLGRNFDAPVLCTLKLSRALYPEHHRHGLDALIERHGLVCDARHRAMGDTDALWQFACLVEQTFPAAALEQAVARAMKAPARPPGLPDGAIEGMPPCSGVYLFFDTPAAPEDGRPDLPIHVGSSVNLRTRVLEHLSAAARKGKDAELVRRVRRVDWIEAAGELDALLLEAGLLKASQPVRERLLQAREEAFALRIVPGRKRPPILEHVRVSNTDPRQWEGLFGAFRHRKEADSLLRELAQLYRLCPRRLGIEPGGHGPCTAYRAKRCAGVCAGKESVEEHDARLLGGLGAARLKPWPWQGAVILSEHDEASGRTAFHVLDHWCHLGTTESRADAQRLAQTAERCFALDTYRMLGRWLASPGHLAAIEVL